MPSANETDQEDTVSTRVNKTDAGSNEVQLTLQERDWDRVLEVAVAAGASHIVAFNRKDL